MCCLLAEQNSGNRGAGADLFFSASQRLSIQIRTIDRKQEVPHDGAMCDLLWSDPDGKYVCCCWFSCTHKLTLHFRN
jgi:hypothetical protein